MHFPAVLSIDFGSTYTKVGYRRAFSAHSVGTFQEEAFVLLLEELALIPTLAIATGRNDRPWVFGPEAASLNPGEGMEVYQNWKAGLFRRDDPADTAQSVIIAQGFFRWLRERLEEVRPDLGGTLVRLMVPAFDDVVRLGGVLRCCMQLAGWRSAIEISTEPHANALGIMTSGRNCYSRGKKFEGVDFMATYGFNSPMVQAARKSVFGRLSSGELRVAVLDIGSFTTDLAILVFDVQTAEGADGLKSVSQQSFELGVHAHLNEPLWSRLAERYHAGFKQLSFNLREEIKRTLFAGGTYAIRVAGQHKEIGGAHDSDIVRALAEAFAKAIWEKIKAALGKAQVSRVYLTGGGAQVPLLVEVLERCGARFSTSDGGAGMAEGKGVRFVPWVQCGEALTRVATAIGGVSIISPVPIEKAPIGLQTVPRKRPAESRDEIMNCTCGGLNPDCGICLGSGYVRRKF